MANYYNNLPQPNQSQDSALSTLKIFDAYNKKPVSIDSSTYDAMVGFFSSRGFGADAAQSMAYVILKQALIDKIKPFELINSLKGLNEIQLSNLITELLNYNRYKSSSLGSASPFSPAEEVARNIVA
jgi:hypothetical protein